MFLPDTDVVTTAVTDYNLSETLIVFLINAWKLITRQSGG
jgi:hypothetical protein